MREERDHIHQVFYAIKTEITIYTYYFLFPIPAQMIMLQSAKCEFVPVNVNTISFNAYFKSEIELKILIEIRRVGRKTPF